MNENIKSFNLFNSKIIIFILVFVFVLFGIIIHNLLKNEEKIPYNFQPYPKFSPKSIPSINLGKDNSCYSILTKCVNGQCPNCTDDFECVTVEREGQFVINNTSVPVGDYCLPKVNKNECNLYTGSWIWVNEPEYCGEKGDQCWKCICKYPDLYDNFGNTTDCSFKKACNPPITLLNIQDTTMYTSSGINLVSTQALYDYDKNIPPGTNWNPLNTTDDPSTLEALKINPYGKSVDGKPYFICDCSKKNESKQYPYVSLINDPYICGENICDTSNPVSIAQATYQSDNTIKCGCLNAGLDIIGGDDNLLKNTCISGNSVCKEFLGSTTNIDNDNIITGCNCADGSYSQKCISFYANVHAKPCNDDWSDDSHQSVPGLPKCINCKDCFPPCTNYLNKIGFECRSACELGKYKLKCQNGGVLSTSTPNSGRTCTAKCNCQDGFKGDTCQTTCLKSGSDNTKLGPPDRYGNPQNEQDDHSKCCSGKNIIGSFTPFGYKWNCS